MSIHAFRTKMIKANVGLLALNAGVSIMQAFFLYSHITADQYWQSAINASLMILNGWVAWSCWGTIKRLKEEEKKAVWGILSK